MKLSAILFISILSLQNLIAQIYNEPKPDEGFITGGAGLIWIDGQPHYRISFRPEVSFSNFGVGLDLNLDFDSQGKLRKENFNELTDYLSIIRYVRYGYKNDPVYLKLGALDYYTLGHGTIVNYYNNSPTFDARKIGLVADIDFGNFGFESIYGNFAQAGLFGIRGFVRPLKFSDAGNIPVIGNLELGASYTTDFDKNATVLSGSYDSQKGEFVKTEDKGALTIIGFDIGLPIVKSGFTTLLLYFDYNKIVNFGSGMASGVKLDLNGLGLVELSAKLERRFNQNKYIPSYFNSFYEIERFKLDTVTNTFSSKALALQNVGNDLNGFYGDLLLRVLGLFDVYGAYQRLDKDPKSGILNLRTDVSPKDGSVILRAGYDKINIQDEKDLFKLDDRSYLFTELGYKPIPYIIVSIVYNWTFSPERDSNDNIVGYKPQKRIEPRMYFVFPINF
ncbi:MAG: hypothetical protein HZC46_13840 [Ignavibacterium album]|uniref:hypothetical protein n=1 Tax=Ignavibacterium album TaxID=591197 RepID=UPI0026EFEDB2|nr:hypothetical protein [Ignavibacterium album]MBI5663216.1 hypothetical protein [Ignavibacterium album]